MDWKILATTFGLIFIAELGDKTQLAVLAQTCKYRRPWAVFLGAALALTAVTALGAVGGQLIGQFIPPDILRWGAALAFVVMGVAVMREAIRGRMEDGLCPDEETGGTVPAVPNNHHWRAFGATFGLLFFAEMGDKTQLAVLGLAGKCAMPWPVFAGGALALAGVTALGVVGGQALARVIPRRALLWGSALTFVVMGILMGLGVC